jgi:hypothetical protein
LTGGTPSVVSTRDGRDSMPSVTGWAELSPAVGGSPSMPSWVAGASGARAGAAGRSEGSEGRAQGARTRIAANQAASQGCSLSRRCRASTGTPVVLPAQPHAARSRPSRQQQSMILAGNSVKGDRRQQQPGLAHRAAGGGAAPSALLRRAPRCDSPLRRLRLYSPPSLA